jgi:lipoprotein-anchoring transpeptidase ErfK/SrfK
MERMPAIEVAAMVELWRIPDQTGAKPDLTQRTRPEAAGMRHFVFALALASVATVAAPAIAAPPYPHDPEERFTGGRPIVPPSRGMSTPGSPGRGLFDGLFSGYGSGPIPRQVVHFPTKHRPGTIVINTAERRLYLVLETGESGQALRYGIGVGRDGFRWRGTHTVTAKREWPDWTPPPQMLKRQPDLPRHMAGGIDNPLGARALYLGSTLYRIHGSNEPETIGTAVSSGCFRLTNEDVIDLYDRVRVGALVIVQ